MEKQESKSSTIDDKKQAETFVKGLWAAMTAYAKAQAGPDLSFLDTITDPQPPSYTHTETPGPGGTTSGFVKDDAAKAQLAWLPTDELCEISKVFDYGAKKYERNNWKKKHDGSRMVSALLRHVFAFIGGEMRDKESGFSHLAHAGCCLLMVMWHVNQKTFNADFHPTKGKKEEWNA